MRFEDALADLGAGDQAGNSVTSLLAGLSTSIDQNAFETGRSSDAGELARSAFLESLSVQLRNRLPSLFDPTPQEIRKAMASFASGQNFAVLARDFFARLSYKSLDYYLSRERCDAPNREAESQPCHRIVGQIAGPDRNRGTDLCGRLSH